MNALTLFNKNLIDNLFEDFDTNFWDATSYSPNTDVVEHKDNYEIRVDVPGFEEKDLNIELKNGYLKISGKIEKTNEEKDEGKKYIIKERCYSKFERTFKLPENTNAEKVDAKLKNGVLNIKVEKKEEEKPKSIKIN